MTRVFIDGSAGTTGLRIHERLSGREDLTLVTLPDELRKDPLARKDALNSCDIAFLCLPDAAAVEAVSLVTNPDTVIIDTSTAHRTNSDWTYGFPELTGKREEIAKSSRIANPGCHASGFVALIAPLIEKGILKNSAKLSSFSLTGYSGGGKKMIAEYESEDRCGLLSAPRQYALGQEHKHLKEMVKICALEYAPLFSPIVADFYSGMEVSVPIFAEDLALKKDELEEFYRAYYKEGLVHFVSSASEDGFLSASAFSGRDDMQISVFGNGERLLLVSRFDNLGKGASGAAIQNMNIVLNVPEDMGLDV